MSKSGEQLRKKTEEEERAEEKASKLRGLPMESSPYLNKTLTRNPIPSRPNSRGF
ncbi:unnamed protein product, partial [Vitis vinifera]